MAKTPLIGITLDAEAPGGWSKFPWYAIRENYCSSIADAGGLPFPLTHDMNLIDTTLSLIDGLLITGGDHDIDPTVYGDTTRHSTVKLKPNRSRFEIALAKAAFKKNIPVLLIFL